MPTRSRSNPTLLPLRALAHPLWWVALALLVANDHLFKGAGVLPAALTGKLSDFAGLLVAPILLAGLCGVRRGRGFGLAHLAVGLGFAAINLSPGLARLVEAATLPTPFPWWITVDPTDLVALPMLLVSAVVFGRFARRPVALRPTLARAGVALGGLACVATSPPPEDMPPTAQGAPFSTEWGLLAVANITNAPVVLRTRTLRAGVEVDCAALAADPGAQLTPDLFDAPTLWSVPAGGLLNIDRFGPRMAEACGVALVATADTQRLLFFQRSRWPNHEIRHEVGLEPTDPAIIAVRDDGGRARFDGHPTLSPAPGRATLDPEPACVGLDPGAGLAWTTPPMAAGAVVGHSVGPDGCHAIDLEDAGRIGRWYVCAPGAPLALPIGQQIVLSAYADEWRQEIRIETSERFIRLYRGTVLGLDLGLSAADPDADSACRAPWRDACDGVVAPLVVRDAEGPLPLGEPLMLGEAEVTVIRAERARVTDGACDPWGTVGPHFELVIDQPLDDNALPASEDDR